MLLINLSLLVEPSQHGIAVATTISLSIPKMPRPATCSHCLSQLKRTHAILITSGSISNLFHSNNLIISYSKCNSLSNARKVFDQTLHKDTVTFNSLISALSQYNCVYETVDVFKQMLFMNLPTTELTFSPLLKLCLNSSHLAPTVQAVHAIVVKIGLEMQEWVSSLLVSVYAKYGFLHDAKILFDTIANKDIVLWNVMINGYAQMGLCQNSFLMFAELHRSEIIQPDTISVSSVLKGREMGLEFGLVHAYGIKTCLLENFSETLSWNKTMLEFVKFGSFDDALKHFIGMRKKGVEIDNVTFVILLSAVAKKNCFELGRQLHGLAIKERLHIDIQVSNNLINMYAKVGNLDSAKRLFGKMKDLDLVSWNSLISATLQKELYMESVGLFVSMINYGILPDDFTITSMIKACLGMNSDYFLYEQVHTLIVKLALLSNVFVSTSLIDAYAKCGSMIKARTIFYSMYSFQIVSFNALINGYITNNDIESTLDIFSVLHKINERPDDYSLATILKACTSLVALVQGKQLHAYALKLGHDSDVCVSSGLLDMYIKCRQIEDTFKAFMDIPEPDDIAWTTIISGLVENNDEEQALVLYNKMRLSKLVPNEFIHSSLVKACSYSASLGQGKQFHANAIKMNHMSDTFVGTSIMDMYAKCGNIKDSYEIFIRTRCKSVASWNAMILGFAQHGNGEKAIELFDKMISNEVKPDKISFLGVITACSHSGLVSKAYEYFDSMLKDYNIIPEVEHYSCLVDTLGRAGLLSKAEEVINTMPYTATASMYRALLGACRNKRNVEIGERVADKLLLLEPHDSSAYVLLSNIYATTKKWDGVYDARRSMKLKNVKKDPGYSWIELKNKLHMFIVDDKSHPESKIIYSELEKIIERIKHEGYVPDTEFVLLDVEEEEKERSLYCHSEKLAIAYGILKTPASESIRVIKNLRVCGDCHNAIKYISKVVGREIIVRDGSRFHCFRDGQCTCGDYW